MKNHELKLPPKAKIATSMRKKGRLLQTYGGMHGLATFISIKMKTPNRHTPRIMPTRTGAEDHPLLGLSFRPYTSRAIPITKITLPSMSIGVSFALAKGGKNRQASTSASPVRIRHNQNIDLQPASDAKKLSVRKFSCWRERTVSHTGEKGTNNSADGRS